MRHVFIVNPVSGKADASGTLVPQIIDAAKKLGADYEILLTEYPGHAVELAAEQAEAGEEVRLYACGGDGTFNEVLRGVRGRANAAVGCIPCGSGNDFVRNFGGREPFLDLERMMRGPAVNIDLIQTEKGIATTICSAGLDAQVAYGIPKFRRLPFCGGACVPGRQISGIPAADQIRGFRPAFVRLRLFCLDAFEPVPGDESFIRQYAPGMKIKRFFLPHPRRNFGWKHKYNRVFCGIFSDDAAQKPLFRLLPVCAVHDIPLHPFHPCRPECGRNASL